MPGGTWLYSAFGILFWYVVVRLGYRIHLHIAACSPHKFECYLWNCYTAFHVAEHIQIVVLQCRSSSLCAFF